MSPSVCPAHTITTVWLHDRLQHRDITAHWICIFRYNIYSSCTAFLPSRPAVSCVLCTEYIYVQWRRRRRYLFDSNSNIQVYKWQIKKHISRARLPENPEVNYAGHKHIQFLFYLETTTTTTILLKHTKKQIQKKVSVIFPSKKEDNGSDIFLSLRWSLGQMIQQTTEGFSRNCTQSYRTWQGIK